MTEQQDRSSAIVKYKMILDVRLTGRTTIFGHEEIGFSTYYAFVLMICDRCKGYRLDVPNELQLLTLTSVSGGTNGKQNFEQGDVRNLGKEFREHNV